jgi:hypothetical protein
MAGDWIKMRRSLLTDPRVVRISSALNADRFRTIGGLFSAWCLFDEQTSDGTLCGYTPEVFDEIVGVKGLSRAMELVGWLEINGDSLKATAFSEHNGQSAKRRAQESVRKMSARNADIDADKKRPREEKRREEKKTDTKVSVSGDFDAWYTHYPKKAGKDAAAKAYAKAIKSITPAELLAASIPRLSELAKRDPQFIPHPATWLNSGGWQDDLAAIAPAAKSAFGPGQNYDPNHDYESERF